MKYTLDIPEYVSVVKRKVDMHYETEANSVHDAAVEFSKHIFKKSVPEIEVMINDQIAQWATEQDYAYHG